MEYFVRKRVAPSITMCYNKESMAHKCFNIACCSVYTQGIKKERHPTSTSRRMSLSCVWYCKQPKGEYSTVLIARIQYITFGPVCKPKKAKFCLWAYTGLFLFVNKHKGWYFWISPKFVLLTRSVTSMRCTQRPNSILLCLWQKKTCVCWCSTASMRDSLPESLFRVGQQLAWMLMVNGFR